MTCKRMLGNASMTTIFIPDVVEHRKFWLMEPCNQVADVLVTAQQIDNSGKPLRPESPCCQCLLFRSTDKSFWMQKREWHFRFISDPIVRSCGLQLYDYLVENWCSTEQPFNQRSLFLSYWTTDCHLCAGNASSARPCPGCALDWGINLHHVNPDCVSLEWLMDTSNPFYLAWYTAPDKLDPEDQLRTPQGLRRRLLDWFMKVSPKETLDRNAVKLKTLRKLQRRRGREWWGITWPKKSIHLVTVLT